MKFREGQRVIIADVGIYDLGEHDKGTVIATYDERGLASGEHGYKVEIDGFHGGILYFRESQLKEERL